MPTPMGDRPQPTRKDVADDPRLHCTQHPLTLTLLSRLRDKETPAPIFAEASVELARQVLWSACRDLAVRSIRVPGFAGRPVEVHEPAERVAGVAILRAGLIFRPAFHALLPEMPVHHLGIERDEDTLEPRIYSGNLPHTDDWADRVLVLDPMLATGGTARAAIEQIRRHHRGRMDLGCIVAAPLGVRTVLDADPDIRVFTAALDERLNSAGYIIPGLGDAGDRYFGTPG